VPGPVPPAEQQRVEVTETPPAPATPGATPATPALVQTRPEVLAAAPRVTINSPRLSGSLSLVGGRIDDLRLKDYRETIDPGSPQVLLLSPPGAPGAYYGEFGWVAPQGSTAATPGPDSRWMSTSTEFSPTAPLTMTYDNGAGLRFTRIVEVDENYLFTVRDRVENTTGAAVTLYPYGHVSRTGTPPTLGFFILHEGPLGVLEETLVEYSYEDLRDAGAETHRSTGGWLGITDKYWLAAVIPDQAAPYEAGFRYSNQGGTDNYQTYFRRDAMTIAAGGNAEVTHRFFAGAKEVATLEAYQERLGIQRFDLAIDWGWFFFLTKPIFAAIDWLYRLFGNFGVAIIVFTIFIRILFFPLANKSFKSMAGMRKIQPEVLRIREAYANDRERQTREIMDLYRKAGVNPLSGCMPILLQIPVFFALYKVLFVTIEMRHAPFYGWIKDLSAPDPTTIFNLFGLIPWTPPGFLMIGVLPIIMGVTMYVQQKLNPVPPDPIQQRIFMLLPIIFTFILAPFPAGLVLYWTVNNVLSMAQQWIIIRQTEAGGGAKAKSAT